MKPKLRSSGQRIEEVPNFSLNLTSALGFRYVLGLENSGAQASVSSGGRKESRKK
jgi:hypothetical protein